MGLSSLATSPAAVHWLRERGVRGLASDSRRVAPGDAFVAWPGTAHDARRFVRDALGSGARACLVEERGAGAFDWEGLQGVASMLDLKRHAGVIASAFLGEPSRQLTMLAVTGTNGKTSTAWWTAQALAALGRRCGVIGTLGSGVPPLPDGPAADRSADGVAGTAATLSAPGLTTPDPIALHTTLRVFVQQGLTACAIEASSIGLAEHRLNGVHLDVAMFTNLTQDHLDYHGTMQAYAQGKARLFDWPGLSAAVINLDDAYGAALADRLHDSAVALWSYSTRREARLRARDIRYRECDGGLGFDLFEGATRARVQTCLIGHYNVSNLLAVVGALRSMGIPLVDAARACASLMPVPGRMQRIGAAAAQDGSAGPAVPDGPAGPVAPAVVVDYAHTPDALDKALLALKPLARQRGGRLWCVFGCGGNRDPGKRGLMGTLAARHAQQVVITSDNPRDEDPQAIVAQIAAGVPPQAVAHVIVDRRAAIAHAVSSAASADVILLAGKGHEDYQEVKGVKLPFSDLEEAQRCLQARSLQP
ncbi:MAG: UDP-N-acetylmuramoyl-L-alanyl-D-glutamate--2,6-diaminopimelate ligase [Burkholderiaceae bacterium]